MLKGKQIAFIGSGAMGEAMIHGLIQQQIVEPGQILASDPVAQRRSQISEQYGVQTTSSNLDAVAEADVIVFSIKPQVLPNVLPELAGKVPPESLVLSIAAGVPMASFTQGLGHARVVRTMPNTPAQVGKGVSVWTYASAVDETQREEAALILGALGVQIMVEDEGYLDMATGLSGSGPAFVFLLIESLIDAGVQIGFSRADAQEMVLQTIDGSVELVRSTGLHPADLRNRVTSPAGTTAAGLFELEKNGVRAALIQAVEASLRRSRELGAAYSQKG